MEPYYPSLSNDGIHFIPLVTSEYFYMFLVALYSCIIIFLPLADIYKYLFVAIEESNIYLEDLIKS